jgi:hypothetical protein
MKSLTFLVFLFGVLTAHAQSEKYVVTMKKNLAMFDSVKTAADYQALSAAFERIGDAEKTQWLPYYYAGLALTTAGWMDSKLDKEANAEKINALCDKAEAIEKSSETCEIRNMAATQQMMIDPQTRWATYGKEAREALERGMQLNPNNPRLYYLQGMSVFNTPEAFGGGKANAKPIFEKAVALFKTEQPAPLHPHWGQQQAEEMLAKCQ